MNPKRPPATLVTLVVCGLVTLGAWTYSSGSSSDAGSPVSVTRPTRVRSGTGKRPHRNSSSRATSDAASTTIAAPLTTVAANPHAYALELFRTWQVRDRHAANMVATPEVVRSLFSQFWHAYDGWADKGCQAGSGWSLCTFTRPKRRYVFEVRAATAALPILVIGLQKTR